MKNPGKILKQALNSFFKKPITVLYPAQKFDLPKGFRGKLDFRCQHCIGCKICMKDCPSGAITIQKIGEKKYEAVVDLAKCIYCAQCVDSCPKKALGVTSEFELANTERGKLKVTLDLGPLENTPPANEPPAQGAAA